MTSTLQVSIRWKDEFLKWNKSVYPNAITFKSSEIWVPDIITTNNVNNFKYDSEETNIVGSANNIFDFNERNKYLILVNPDGDCRWVFPLKLLSMCELNQEYFPFDIQECAIDLRSSAFLNEQLVLKKFGDGVHLKLINEGEFDLIKAEAIDLTQKSSFDVDYDGEVSVVRVKMLMKRKMVFYLNKIILPYFVFYIVVVLTYILPVESGEKKSYSTSILISAMIYLKDISNFIPKTSMLPMLSIYFNLNLIFIFFCIMITTFIYLVYYCDKTKRPLPNFFKRIVQNSNYFNHEKISRQESLKIGIKNELLEVNNIIESLNKNLLLDKTLSPNKAIKKSAKNENKIEDVLGKDVLDLLKTLKLFIVNQNQNQNKLKLVEDSWHTNSESMENVKFLNTLENLKFHLVNINHSNGIHFSSPKFTKQNSIKQNNLLNSYSKSQTYLNDILTSFPSFLHSNDKLNFGQRKIYQSCFLNDQDEDSRDRNSHYKKGQMYLNYLKEYKAQVKNYLRHLNKYQYQEVYFTNWLQIKNVDSYAENQASLVQEWKFLAMIIDRVIFFLFCFSTPVCLLIMYLKTLIF